MKETQIKIADLLLSIWSTDAMNVDGIMISRIDWLRTPGISLDIFLHSIDEKTIVVTINSLSCSIDDVSDVSTESFVRDIQVSDYVWKFVLGDSLLVDDGDDPTFPIQGDYLDLEEMIYQAIYIQEPLIKRTPIEQREYDKASLDDEIDDDASWIDGGVVTIHG